MFTDNSYSTSSNKIQNSTITSLLVQLPTNPIVAFPVGNDNKVLFMPLFMNFNSNYLDSQTQHSRYFEFLHKRSKLTKLETKKTNIHNLTNALKVISNCGNEFVSDTTLASFTDRDLKIKINYIITKIGGCLITLSDSYAQTESEINKIRKANTFDQEINKQLPIRRSSHPNITELLQKPIQQNENNLNQYRIPIITPYVQNNLTTSFNYTQIPKPFQPLPTPQISTHQTIEKPTDYDLNLVTKPTILPLMPPGTEINNNNIEGIFPDKLYNTTGTEEYQIQQN